MYRIKHKLTGLYWQPSKGGGSHLSVTGKVYGKRGWAERVLREDIKFIGIPNNSRVAGKVSEAYKEPLSDNIWGKKYKVEDGDFEIEEIKG